MDPKVVQRLKEVEEVVVELDETVRSAAFGMMESYVLTGLHGSTAISTAKSSEKKAPAEEEPPERVALDEFFSHHDPKKPADAVFAIAAYFYQLYGSEPFSVDDVRELADRVGLTISSRPDMTLKTTRKGKPIFRTAGRGKFAPTVHGEAWLKETFSISKGRNSRTSSGETTT